MVLGVVWSLTRWIAACCGAKAVTALAVGAVSAAIVPSAVSLYVALHTGPGGPVSLAAFVLLEVVVAIGLVRPRASIAVGAARSALKVVLSQGASLMALFWISRVVAR